MRTIRLSGVALGLAMSIVLFSSGCESDDSPSWTAPDDISGTWIADYIATDWVASMQIVITQNKNKASAVKSMTMSEHGRTLTYKGSGTYENGLLTLDFGIVTPDYYRFTDDGKMHALVTPEYDRSSVEYVRQ